MLSSSVIRPLSRALKYLIGLLGLVILLLIATVASLNYINSEERRIQVEEFEKIESDTLSHEVAARALSGIKLMTAPSQYDNQKLWVKGYLNLEFEGDAIYWRQRDYRANHDENSFYVHFTDSLYEAKPVANYSQHYVMLKGTFIAYPGMRSGAIRDIDSLNVLPMTAR